MKYWWHLKVDSGDEIPDLEETSCTFDSREDAIASLRCFIADNYIPANEIVFADIVERLDVEQLKIGENDLFFQD